MILDDIKTYPEIKKYILTNTFSGHSDLVTLDQLKAAFGDTLPAILAGRNDCWIIEDYYDDYS